MERSVAECSEGVVVVVVCCSCSVLECSVL